jgi:hypothetical protein
MGSTTNSQQNSSYKIGNNPTLNISLNFQGVQTFLEKSDKFSKIPCFLDILEYNFKLTHLYSKIESYFTSGKMT